LGTPGLGNLLAYVDDVILLEDKIDTVKKMQKL
jgi:hypothetical protein